MDEKTRIKETIKYKKTDKIPWQINYTYEMGKKLLEYLKLQEPHFNILGKNVYIYNNLNNFLGNHIAYIRNEAVNSFKEINPDVWEDEWQVLWNRSIDKYIGNTVNCLLDEMDLKNIRIPDPDLPERYAHFNSIIETNPNRFIVVRFPLSLFERAWALRGMENLMMDFKKNPQFAKELFDIITDFNIRIIKNLRNFKIDAIRFGDDWGYQKGLLISPETWREFIKPCIRRMYNQAHMQGYNIIIHSCGDIKAILDDIVELGVDVFNPFQPEVMNIKNVIIKYSNRLAFYGGLSIQRTLPFGTSEEVRKDVDDLIHLARNYSGLIISPSHDLPHSISINNVLAIIDRIKCQ